MLVVTSFNSEFQEVTISGYCLGKDWYPNWVGVRVRVRERSLARNCFLYL